MSLFNRRKPSNPYNKEVKTMGPNQTSFLIRKLIRDNKELKSRVDELEKKIDKLCGRSSVRQER